MVSKLIDINLLKTNPNNPRIIKDDKFKKLVQSIKNFPEMLELRPIIANDKMMVLGGNMRLKACQEAGIKKVPCVVTTIDKKKQNEFIIKDNVGFGEWDWETLANEWDQEELEEWGLDVKAWHSDSQEDDYEVPDDIKTDLVRGDLIEIGSHRLLCGDSTDSEQVARLMNGEKADMVFTDPPYGVDYKGINNDSRAGLELLLEKSFLNYSENSLPGAPFYCFHSDKCADIFNAVFRKYCHFSCQIIWIKDSLVMGRGDYHSRHEPVLYGWTNGGSHVFFGDRKQTTTWEFERPKRSEGHTTMKPVQMVAKAIQNSSKSLGLVLDLFLGSGTTMVAAHQLNRKCYGMELDPKYCQVVIDRMTKLVPGIQIKINGQKKK